MLHHINMHIYIYMCVCVCVCVYIYIYIVSGLSGEYLDKGLINCLFGRLLEYELIYQPYRDII